MSAKSTMFGSRHGERGRHRPNLARKTSVLSVLNLLRGGFTTKSLHHISGLRLGPELPHRRLLNQTLSLAVTCINPEDTSQIPSQYGLLQANTGQRVFSHSLQPNTGDAAPRWLRLKIQSSRFSVPKAFCLQILPPKFPAVGLTHPGLTTAHQASSHSNQANQRQQKATQGFPKNLQSSLVSSLPAP